MVAFEGKADIGRLFLLSFVGYKLSLFERE